MELVPGGRLSRFLLEKQLGKGASGVVFLAKDTLLGQPVALKVLHPWLVDDNEVRERFKREIVLTRRIASTGVCRLHDLHEDDGHTFITMEYVEGQTLASLIHKDGRQSPARVLEILRGLVPALKAAHDVGVVHRDLKPGNIMIKPDGAVCVLDFGMATASDVTKITQAGRTVGSLRFIAPEVWQGDPATAQSDIYAVGVVLFACMAGRLPYEATTPAEAFKAQKQGPPSLIEHNTTVTPGVDAVVRQAMARRPADRFKDVNELLVAFERAVNNEEATSSTGTLIVRPRDGQDPDNVRLTPLKEAEGEVFAQTPAQIPKPALVAAAVAVAVVLAAVVAAIASRPAHVDASPGDGGPLQHFVDRTPLLAPIADASTGPGGNGPGSKGPGSTSSGAGTAEPAAAGSKSAAPHEPGTNAGLAGAMKKRGILPGDLPKVDALAAKARRAEAAGNSADAAAAVDKARDLVNRAVIDRGFITAKQKRLSFAADRASAANQGKIGALQSEVERLVVARDYAGANERLNRAFALVR